MICVSVAVGFAKLFAVGLCPTPRGLVGVRFRVATLAKSWRMGFAHYMREHSDVARVTPGHTLLPRSPFSYGLRGQRIVWPTVFGITTTQILADLRIGTRPESSEVVGDLFGSVVGAEQVQ